MASTVVVQDGLAVVAPSNVDQRYRHSQSLVLGIIQIICGGICIVFNIVALTDTVGVINHALYLGSPGIWCSALFMLAGSFSIMAGRTKREGFISASLGLNIVSNVLAFVLFVWGCIGLTVAAVAKDVYTVWSYNDWSDDNGATTTVKPDLSEYRMTMAVSGIFVIMSTTVFVVSTWLYILGCMSCCRGDPVRTTTSVTVMQTHPPVNCMAAPPPQYQPPSYMVAPPTPHTTGVPQVKVYGVPPRTAGVQYQQFY